MKKINIGNCTVYTGLDVDIDINKPIKLDRTVQDFNGDENLFNLYKQINDTFKRYEEKILAEKKGKS